MMPTVPRVPLKGPVECHHLGVQSPNGACEVFRLHGPEQEHPALMERIQEDGSGPRSADPSLMLLHQWDKLQQRSRGRVDCGGNLIMSDFFEENG
jgi:hypothetical protein